MKKRLDETVNPYDRTKLYNIGIKINNQYLKMKPNTSQVKNNIKKFLNNLKKTDDETCQIKNALAFFIWHPYFIIFNLSLIN